MNDKNSEPTKKYKSNDNKWAPFESLKLYRGVVPSGVDEKKELAEARNAKYADFS